MIMDRFISENKDIIIELDRKEISNRFHLNDKGYKYLCTLIFKNNLGTVLKTLTVSDIEISVFLDNMYNFLEMNMPELYFSFNMDNSNCISTIIKIELVKNNLGIYHQVFKLYDYVDDITKHILSFEFSENYVEFCDKLYNTYIIDSNVYDKYFYDPSNFL